MHSLSSGWWSVVVPKGRPAFSAKTVPVITNWWQTRATVLGERKNSEAISSSVRINRNLCQTTLQRRSSEYAAGIDVLLQQSYKEAYKGLLNIERNIFREQDTSNNKLRILHGSAEIRNFSSSELSERVKYFSTQEEKFRIFKRPVMLY